MAQSAPARTKINTKVTQPGPGRPSRRPAGRPGPGRPPRGPRVSGDARESVRQPDRPVIELGFGIVVYPPEAGGEPWRAVFTENGQRRFRQGATEAKLAAKLEKVRERLQADAAEHGAARRGPDRALPGPRPAAGRDRWSRKHAHTQRRLCERFAAPVIGAVTCQDIKTGHMQQIVNAAPTAGEGDRVQGMISALVTAGIEGGYLASPRLAKVHWQAGGRPLPAPRVTVAGESALWVDPAEIPSDDDIGKLGQALAAGLHGERDELMASTAAYSGLRWGELTALTISQVDPAGRVITVDRKVVEVAGHLYVEAPKNRKYRRTIYPRLTPAGYPLAERLAARIEPARAEQAAGTNPLGLIFPSPEGQALAVLQLQPQRPQARLPRGRLARRGRQRQVDLAQPAARVLHHRPVHLEARRHRRVLHGRARQRPHHPADVRRHHRRRPRPRPPGHRLNRTRPRPGAGRGCAGVPPGSSSPSRRNSMSHTDPGQPDPRPTACRRRWRRIRAGGSRADRHLRVPAGRCRSAGAARTRPRPLAHRGGPDRAPLCTA